MAIKTALRDILVDFDLRWDRARLKLLRSLGGAGKLHILGYRGLGRPDRLLLKGRVLVNRGPTTHQSDDDIWDDLVNMYRRLNTTEIPGAKVRVTAAGAVAEAVTDDEGYFDVELDAAGRPFSSPLQPVEMELIEPEKETRAVTRTEAVVRSANSRYLVISDVDDTVVHTQATNLLAMARATFLGNARSRTPFPGVAALYSALVDGQTGSDENPLIFISRSPWNLYDLFDQFCDLQRIPRGRVFYLRDWGFSLEGLATARARGHKFGLIRRILEFEPELPVILIGDSGQKDPEIYHAISEEHPGRLMGAFIRNVSRSPARAEAIAELSAKIEGDGAVLYLVDDSLEVARKAADHGWIRPDAVREVETSMDADNAQTDALDELIDPPASTRSSDPGDQK